MRKYLRAGKVRNMTGLKMSERTTSGQHLVQSPVLDVLLLLSLA